MAVNEEIVTGKKFRRLIDIATNKWRRYSFWNKAKDTECEDGTDVETKVGAIKGITTSTNVSETGYAADAKTVSEINQSLTNINTYVGKDKKLHFVDSSGADTVLPFKSYDQGYAQGVTDADNRANANSTNYKTGYNNGYNAGKSDGALTGVSGCCIAGWRSIDAYSNNQWVSGWTGVNPNYFTVNGYGIVPKRNFTATVYWQGYNKRDIDFYSNGVMGHRDNGTSMNGVKMNFYAGTQCGFKTNDSGGGSLGAGFIVLN